MRIGIISDLHSNPDARHAKTSCLAPCAVIMKIICSSLCHNTPTKASKTPLTQKYFVISNGITLSCPKALSNF